MRRTSAVGDTFTLLSVDNKRAEFEVKGIYEPPPFYPLLGSVSITESAFDSLYEHPRNLFTFVDVEGEPTTEARRLRAAGGLRLPRRKGVDARRVDRLAGLGDRPVPDIPLRPLALSVIVSIFGMINTLVLSVVRADA